MVIPAAPIRRPLQSRFFEREDVLRTPFPFMSGAQAIFSSASSALLYGIHLLDYTPQKVHVPAYCCKSVLLPIEKLKIKVRFYDVGEHLKPLVNSADFNKGDLFLLIHYFGIPQDTAILTNYARSLRWCL